MEKECIFGVHFLDINSSEKCLRAWFSNQDLEAELTIYIYIYGTEVLMAIATTRTGCPRVHIFGVTDSTQQL